MPARNLASCDGFGFLGRLDFKIDDGAAGFGGFEQDFEFGGEGASEVAAKLFAAAGGDGGQVAVLGQELLQAGKGGRGFGQGVEPELEEFGFFGCRGRPRPHFRRGGGLDGDAELAQPRPGNAPGAGQLQPCWSQTRDMAIN